MRTILGALSVLYLIATGSGLSAVLAEDFRGSMLLAQRTEASPDTDVAEQCCAHTATPRARVTGTEAVKGKITRIDVKSHQLVVTRVNGTTVGLLTSETTQVRQGPHWGGLADLRPGDRVLVVYNLDDGRNRAQIITIE